MNALKVKALVNNMKREHPDLVANFSKHALFEIAKDKIAEYPRLTNNIGFLTARCIESMKNQLETTHEDQTDLLLGCLENDYEYSPEKIKEMTPRQKVKDWLEYYSIQGYTDDILDVVSAAYGIVLEPDLNR